VFAIFAMVVVASPGDWEVFGKANPAILVLAPVAFNDGVSA